MKRHGIVTATVAIAVSLLAGGGAAHASPPARHLADRVGADAPLAATVVIEAAPRAPTIAGTSAAAAPSGAVAPELPPPPSPPTSSPPVDGRDDGADVDVDVAGPPVPSTVAAPAPTTPPMGTVAVVDPATLFPGIPLPPPAPDTAPQASALPASGNQGTFVQQRHVALGAPPVVEGPSVEQVSLAGQADPSPGVVLPVTGRASRGVVVLAGMTLLAGFALLGIRRIGASPVG